MSEQSRSMSVLRETWLLLKAQMRYRRNTVALVLLLEVSGVAFFLLLAKPDERWVAAAVAAVLGGAVGIFGLGVDAFERRIRLLVMLPITRTAVAMSRLLGAAALQLLLSTAAWGLAVGVSLLRGGEPPPLSMFAETALWSLAVVYVSMLFEEISVALSGNKMLVYGVNFGFLVLTGAAVVLLEDLFLSAERIGLLLAVPVTLILGLLAILMFWRRSTLDVGINPWHGLPTDWSEG